MRFCRTLLFIISAMQITMLLARGGMPQDDGTKPPAGVRSAFGAIFADAHVAQEALQIHERAMRLDETTRFELLSKWVIPSENHNTLRMQFEFTPTCPAPMFERSGDAASESSGSEHRQFTGGDLVSPAMDLVDVAARLNRLDDIRNVIDQWNVTSFEDQKSRIVFQLLVTIAQQDSAGAEGKMREILALAAAQPSTAWERHIESVAVWAGGDFPATRELARELAVLLQQDVLAGKGADSRIVGIIRQVPA